MLEGALGAIAPPRRVGDRTLLWAARAGAGAAAFVIGVALARAGHPLLVPAALLVGAGAIALAITRPRWCLVASLALLVSYVPDAVAGSAASHALIAVSLLGAALAWRHEHMAMPRVLALLGALAAAHAVSAVFAADRGVAFSEVVELVSLALVVVLVVVLVDSGTWLRRAAWAMVAGIGLLAVLAVFQQLTHSYGRTFSGLATVLRSAGALRSAGPLNPNPFGEVLAVAAVLAFYLARVEPTARRRRTAGVLSLVCAVAVVYTQSRAAIIALVVAAALIAVLRGARTWAVVGALAAAFAVGALVLPHTLTSRVGDLYAAATSSATSSKDSAIRGRASENLAALQMWEDHPLLGVGPNNYEVHYLAYSQRIGIDPRPEQRSAHDLYLEALAETGVVGGLTFFAILALALRGAWRARTWLAGADALLGEGVFVALVAFLVCSATLNSAYARYEWIFIGLGLAAGRLAARAAP